MEIKGTIKKIGTTETIGNNGFQKRQVIIETGGNYPETLAIEFVQDKTAILDNYNVGNNVVIGINLRGREWTNPEGEVKYFNSIQGWRITNEAEPMLTPPMRTPPSSSQTDDQSNDLPF